MTESLPATAVVRVARLSFDPSRFAEVDALGKKQAEYRATLSRAKRSQDSRDRCRRLCEVAAGV